MKNFDPRSVEKLHNIIDGSNHYITIRFIPDRRTRIILRSSIVYACSSQFRESPTQFFLRNSRKCLRRPAKFRFGHRSIQTTEPLHPGTHRVTADAFSGSPARKRDNAVSCPESNNFDPGFDSKSKGLSTYLDIGSTGDLDQETSPGANLDCEVSQSPDECWWLVSSLLVQLG